MFSLLRKYRKDREGAIAVETAIVTPILIFILLPAIDLGMQVVTMQKMSKAADSGIEYVVNGGRDEATLRNIVQDSFGSRIGPYDLSVEAYCGCIISNSENETEETAEVTDPYASVYVKTRAQLSENMCSTTCSDGSLPSGLVEVVMYRKVDGVWKSKVVAKHLQTRIK